MIDVSEHPTVVEYAVQFLFKDKTPAKAAALTKQNLHGYSNVFFGGGEPASIDERRLLEAIWARLIAITLISVDRLKVGKEHYALDGIASQFSQKSKAFRKELKSRVLKLKPDLFAFDEE